MQKLPSSKDLKLSFATGILDGRSPAGSVGPNDYRVLLNVDTLYQPGKARLPGWTARLSEGPSNEDLHDQLLGGSGFVDGSSVFHVYAGQREAITTTAELRSSYGAYYNIACTKTRIYVSSGQGRNWRIIADNLAGGYVAGESPWPNVRMQVIQVGDYALFSNGIDPVLAWPLGGAIIATGPSASRRWAAFEIFDMLGVGIDKAGVIAEWQGFTFAADVNVDGNQYGSRIYWSDENAPLEWAPGGDSLAGFVELGNGEQVLAIAPIGGQMRVYTDQAIYSITLVGGDAIFLFQEIYRGDLALAYRYSFTNLGSNHLWMTQDSIVNLSEYDKVPTRFEWIHKAAGFIFAGMDGRLTSNCPVLFPGFNPLDAARCHQISTGYDKILGNVWISWPTIRNSNDTPDDPDDFDGVRRVTLILNPRYSKATLVDLGFSSFSILRKSQWETIRDFMLENGVCSSAQLLSNQNLLDQKEGIPLNEIADPGTLPLYIWNATEDPTLPMDPNSVSARVCDIRMDIECKSCVAAPEFVMASAGDLTLKSFDISSRLRWEYDVSTDTSYSPTNIPPGFPNVLTGSYDKVGYDTLIQGEVSKYGGSGEKIVRLINLDYDVEIQTLPGRLFTQLGVSNTPHCISWTDSDYKILDCLQMDVGILDQRPAEPANFSYYNVGTWISYRIFLADATGMFKPKGCGVSFSDITISAQQKSETWTNLA